MIRGGAIGAVVMASLGLTACGGGGGNAAPEAPAAATPRAPAATAFVDVTAASNLAWTFGMSRPATGHQSQVGISTRGGVAAGDCDGDGDIDLFVTYGDTDGSGPGGPNRLYLNQLVPQGNGLVFEDRAAAAGVALTRGDGRGNDRHSGPGFADMDGDGDLDLFVGGLYADPSRIYENRGDCTFRDVTANSPELEAMTADYTRAVHTISAAFGDYDLDGDLDMFLTHWGTVDSIYGFGPDRVTDHLWRNVSDGSGIRFVNASAAAGISDIVFATRSYAGSTQFADFTFTPNFAHLNDDAWPDIAIAGDFGTSQVAINTGDGRFAILPGEELRKAQYGMGAALGDYDDDGDLDWFVTSVFGPGSTGTDQPLGNRFFVNRGGAGLFADDAPALGVVSGGWGWAACFLDIDNDGDLDLYHTNGWPDAFLGAPAGYYAADPSRAFVQDGGRFTSQGAALGLDSAASGRGVVCADFDHDGDIDLLELTDAPGNSARLWKNDTAAAGNNFLRLRLEGLPPNTEAAGARLYVRIGASRRMREIVIGSNYTSQNPSVQIVGLGAATRVDEIRVEWPAVDAGAGPVRPPPTVLTGADPRLVASAPGTTHRIRHPQLPPP